MPFYMQLPQQSPIDLGAAQPIDYCFPDGYFTYKWDASEVGTKEDGPHGPEITFKNSASHADLILPGQTSPTSFQLVKFHFHAESEHRVNKKRWPLELHVVHKTTEPDPFIPGSLREIYLAVGIFIDRLPKKQKQDGPAERFFRGLTDSLKEADASGLKSFDAPDPVRPRDLLPDDPSAYWRYEGSLTSLVDRPNDGYVSWIVLQDVKLIDGKVLDDYIARLKHKAKEPQDLDRRFVFFNPKRKAKGMA